MPTTTVVDLDDLLVQVDEASARLPTSPGVPARVCGLVAGSGAELLAATPMRLEAAPYLTTALFAAAFRAEKALRLEDPAEQRRDVVVALEQFRHALRDIVANRPFGPDVA